MGTEELLKKWEQDLENFPKWHDPYSADPKYLDLERKYLELADRFEKLISIARTQALVIQKQDEVLEKYAAPGMSKILLKWDDKDEFGFEGTTAREVREECKKLLESVEK